MVTTWLLMLMMLRSVFVSSSSSIAHLQSASTSRMRIVPVSSVRSVARHRQAPGLVVERVILERGGKVSG